MAKIISLANQKGGVGKTTTAVNLSAALAIRGCKVLLIDLDPQGNAGSGLGCPISESPLGIYELMTGTVSFFEVAKESNIAGLHLVPAGKGLLGAELELATIEGRESLLKNAIEPYQGNYDYIIIDCPPSLGLLTVNGLKASDSVLVPLQCEYYALEGITALMETVELAKRQINTSLELEGVVLTMYDGRTNLSRQVASETKSFFKDKLFSAIVPRNIRLSECPSHGQSIFEYEPGSLGAGAYKALADELRSRNPHIEDDRKAVNA